MSNVYIEYSTMKKAAENADSAMKALKKAIATGTPAEIKEAIAEYKRASSDYRSFIKVNYNL